MHSTEFRRLFRHFTVYVAVRGDNHAKTFGEIFPGLTQRTSSMSRRITEDRRITYFEGTINGTDYTDLTNVAYSLGNALVTLTITPAQKG